LNWDTMSLHSVNSQNGTARDQEVREDKVKEIGERKRYSEINNSGSLINGRLGEGPEKKKNEKGVTGPS